MIDGNRVMDILAPLRTDEVVVTTMSSAKAWPELSRRPDLDIPLTGAMGKASSLGLGIALARPDKRVIVLDGDGSLLMNLGSLVTIGGLAPRNLLHVVLAGRSYDTSGGQPTPGGQAVDFATIAKGAGYRSTTTITDEADLIARLPGILAEEGPVFLCIEVNSMWAKGRVPTGGLGRQWPVLAETLRSE
ncbi:MAG: thiamine pyrophosphate-dependent enzyme [Chloroflexota bacterium]